MFFGHMSGDGDGYWDVEYDTTLYLKVGGGVTIWTLSSSSVTAYAYGRVRMNIDGVDDFAHGGVIRSNNPIGYTNYDALDLNHDKGTFGDETSVGPLENGIFSVIDGREAGSNDAGYEGLGGSDQIDVFLRKAVKLSGTKRVEKKDVFVLFYNSYGWLHCVNEASGGCFADAVVTHDALHATYRDRTLWKTEYEDGIVVKEAVYNRWKVWSDYLEKEVSWVNGKKVIKYYVKARYAEYKDPGHWKVTAEAFDSTNTKIPAISIKKFEMK